MGNIVTKHAGAVAGAVTVTVCATIAAFWANKHSADSTMHYETEKLRKTMELANQMIWETVFDKDPIRDEAIKHQHLSKIEEFRFLSSDAYDYERLYRYLARNIPFGDTTAPHLKVGQIRTFMENWVKADHNRTSATVNYAKKFLMEWCFWKKESPELPSKDK